jgi:hypothetical protein
MNRRDFFQTGANLVSGIAVGRVTENALNSRFTEFADWLNAKYDALALDSKKAVTNLYEELAVTSQRIDKRFSRIEVQQFILMIWATALTLVSGIDLISPLIELI